MQQGSMRSFAPRVAPHARGRKRELNRPPPWRSESLRLRALFALPTESSERQLRVHGARLLPPAVRRLSRIRLADASVLLFRVPPSSRPGEGTVRSAPPCLATRCEVASIR